MKQKTIAFNERQYEKLREESTLLGSSIASIIRSAVEEYLQKKEMGKNAQ